MYVGDLPIERPKILTQNKIEELFTVWLIKKPFSFFFSHFFLIAALYGHRVFPVVEQVAEFR